MKSTNAYKKLFSGYQSAGRDVYVIKSSFETFEHIFKHFRSDYHMTSIMRKIVSLNADPLQSKGNNPAGDIRTSKSGNITLQYSLHNGAVFIEYMQIAKPETSQHFGLYPVTFNKKSGLWAPAEKPNKAIDKNQQWKNKQGTAHYAAVAGRFDDKESAGNLLSQHIIGAYTKSKHLTPSDAEDSFSMFWSEKGQHKSPEAAQALASIMQQSSKSGIPVNWLVHDAGTDTFKSAAKILKATPLATVKDRKAKEKAGMVKNQNVYFSNPNTSSESTLEKLCTEAGLEYIGLNTNNRDLRRFGTLKNVGMEMAKAASLGIVATGGYDAAAMATRQMGGAGLEKAINNGFDAMLSGNHIAIIASIVATGFIAVGIFKKSKAVATGMHCTFGKGNQKWYTNDDELMA